MKFYDRETEINILKENEKQARSTAVFTVLMGRKRVGKTTLLTMVAEIKRNPNKINLAELQKKVDALPQQSFGDYALSLCGLSLEDM